MANKKLTLTDRVKLLEKESRAHKGLLRAHNLRLADLEEAPSPEPDALKTEPWVPKVGDIVAMKDASCSDIMRIEELKYINDRSCPPCAYGNNPKWGAYVHELRPATSEEIDRYQKEWEGRKSLEERDACETTEAQWNELLCIAGDLVRNDEHNDYQHSPNVRWDTYGTVTGLFKTSPVQKWDMGYGLKWLPFPVFKRLLIAEVERKKEEEAKKPLHLRFLDSVKVKDCDERAVFWQKVDDEYWVLLEHGGIHHLKRDQISVL